jgi:hypothetical protein
MSKSRTKALKGYKRRDVVSHRRYNRKASLKRFHKTGKFTTVAGGSGHAAGEKWAKEKNIDPESRVTRYGKNSPSFDEGVYKHKMLARTRALLDKKK